MSQPIARKNAKQQRARALSQYATRRMAAGEIRDPNGMSGRYYAMQMFGLPLSRYRI